jgi:beta-mannosidase
VYEQTFHIAGVVKGKSLKEFVENSQDYQSELIKYAVERYRQHKGTEISGIFHFMLLEPWPAVSYSVTDYFRNRKKGYYILQKCFQPVLVISSLQRKIYGLGHKIEGQFWIVNDHFRDFDGARIEISLRYGKKVLHKYNSVMINIGRDACKEVTNIVYSDTKGLVIPKGIKPGPCELVLEVYDAFSSRLSANTEELVLEKIPKEIVQFNAEFVWE